MVLLILYGALALGVSFVCSVLEAVLLSVTPSWLAMADGEGQPAAARLREFKKDIDRPLAAILSLNTIAHTVGAAGVGAQAAVVFASVPVGVISGVLTLAILVFSEIIPKTLGAQYWKPLAPMVARVLVPVIWSMWPLVQLARGIAWLMSPKDSGASVSREELAAMAELGREEGVLAEDESRILANLFSLGSLRVRSIMTPRIVLFALPEAMTVLESLEASEKQSFTRIPLYRENRDQITGYVLKGDVLLAAARAQGDLPLTELRRDVLTVPIEMPLRRLLALFLDKREHIALVAGEFGGTAGVVTMEDVVETLLGLEIVDEADSVEDMQELARQKWLERAKRLGIVDPSDPERADEVAHWSQDA